MPNDPTPARPELPNPDSVFQGTALYSAATVRKLLADERRKALRDVKHAITNEYTKRRHEKVASEYSEGFLNGLDRADGCVRALIDRKEPTT